MPHESSVPPTPEVTRRVMLRGAAVTGVAVPFLAACGSDEEPADTGDTGVTGDTGDTGDSTGPLASTSDVPVGEGMILTEEQIVLTQPTDGDFKAFTAVCTHQGCTVASVADGTITCDCHGSTYSAENGEVTGGPATAPLEEIPIKVQGDQILMG